MRQIPLVLTLLSLLTLSAAGQGTWTTTKSGLQYRDLKVGAGEPAMKGNKVQVQYTGWLYTEGKRGAKFDSSRDTGKPFEFRLGNREVVDGWDEGVEGMKPGGTRELIIPPNLAYGSREVAGIIPPNSTLNFEIELLRVMK
jgi:FKBP-type peptidyl-prolyl cis-trans isomerase